MMFLRLKKTNEQIIKLIDLEDHER